MGTITAHELFLSPTQEERRSRNISSGLIPRSYKTFFFVQVYSVLTGVNQNMIMGRSSYVSSNLKEDGTIVFPEKRHDLARALLQISCLLAERSLSLNSRQTFQCGSPLFLANVLSPVGPLVIFNVAILSIT